MGKADEIRSDSGRVCFVIMPFSATASCSEQQWTEIFEIIIKPAVELVNYDCRRSSATRGSIIKRIIEDLDSSWVVLADLTDQNPNVFYELGVRHALHDRTILVAQHRDDIPFDLESYANHIYDWKTDAGRIEFANKIKALLQDVDNEPSRADNPVSDFLAGRRPRSTPSANEQASIVSRLEALERNVFGRQGKTEIQNLDSILGTLFDEEHSSQWSDVGIWIAKQNDAASLRRVVRHITSELTRTVPGLANRLSNLRPPGDTIQKDQIGQEATKFQEGFAPSMRNVESLALGLATTDWVPSARATLEIAGALISAGESLSGVRFVTGLPSFFAWRLILLAGARSVQEENLAVTDALINQPIPAVRLGGQQTFQSLAEHSDLFHAGITFGYADLAIKLVASLYEASPHVQGVFATETEYLNSLSEFLLLVALRDAVDEGGKQLYPGYRLLRVFEAACGNLIKRVVTDKTQLRAVARIFGLTEDELKEQWPKLANRANAVGLGQEYWNERRIPEGVNFK